MQSLRHWQQHISVSINHFFALLAEADTPESWGERIIPTEIEQPTLDK